jgi:hypothetical protein
VTVTNDVTRQGLRSIVKAAYIQYTSWAVKPKDAYQEIRIAWFGDGEEGRAGNRVVRGFIAYHRSTVTAPVPDPPP